MLGRWKLAGVTTIQSQIPITICDSKVVRSAAGPLRPAVARMDDSRIRSVSIVFAASGPALGVILALALIYRLARQGTATWRSVLPGAAARHDSVLGSQSTIWDLRTEDAVWTCLRWTGRAAIGLMEWMEFSATIVFLGAAWNAESAALDD